MSEKRFTFYYERGNEVVIEDNGKRLSNKKVVDLLNEQQATITKLEQICEKKMQEIENIKYSLKEIAYKYQKEVQFKADTDPNQAVKEVLCEQQATITKLRNENIILENKIEDLRVSLFIQDKELQRQMQKSDLNE